MYKTISVQIILLPQETVLERESFVWKVFDHLIIEVKLLREII